MKGWTWMFGLSFLKAGQTIERLERGRKTAYHKSSKWKLFHYGTDFGRRISYGIKTCENHERICQWS
ncbi:hypothetical protein SAMN02745136_02042 [Anaerocolumna jejuensis DSM 15929]|uniref:Uncharacterized protein n=1 Tax=Anaerocolumna jejuensis DSM 15929 TaxID=1121322 RepID=A0A1M6QUP2_9FIRM|nr:hypothetical protein SAMN02745136_02042 [Anaerocolumna jejuensis DSM 15929]